jgi:hypothetical protein
VPDIFQPREFYTGMDGAECNVTAVFSEERERERE